jgi:hypothetical protein
MIRIMEQRRSEELEFDEEEYVAEFKDKNYSSSTFQSDSSGKSQLNNIIFDILIIFAKSHL